MRESECRRTSKTKPRGGTPLHEALYLGGDHSHRGFGFPSTQDRLEEVGPGSHGALSWKTYNANCATLAKLPDRAEKRSLTGIMRIRLPVLSQGHCLALEWHPEQCRTKLVFSKGLSSQHPCPFYFLSLLFLSRLLYYLPSLAFLSPHFSSSLFFFSSFAPFPLCSLLLLFLLYCSPLSPFSSPFLSSFPLLPSGKSNT